MGLGENDVNLLQVTARGFRVEEPGEGHAAKVDECKEEIDAPGTGVGENGSEHDDGKVGDPVGASRGRGRHGTSAERVDLGWVDPGQRQSGEGEEADEEEDPDDGPLGVLRGAVNQAAHGDDETETLAKETDQEELAAANLFDHEERGDGCEGVDRGKDTTQDQWKTARHVQILLEEQRGVVDGGIAAGELLEELARATDNHALEFLGLAKGEERLPAGLVLLGRSEVGLHEVEIGEHTLRIGVGVVELGQHVARLLIASPHDKPARRLGQHQRADSHHDGEDDLERHGEPPLHRGIDVRETKVDPVGDERADSDNGPFETDQETPIVRARTFRLPDRDGCRIHAVSKT